MIDGFLILPGLLLAHKIDGSSPRSTVLPIFNVFEIPFLSITKSNIFLFSFRSMISRVVPSVSMLVGHPGACFRLFEVLKLFQGS